MKRSNEKGVALVLTLILLLVISVMGVSLMFVSQTETWSSLNYRLMSQARDGAEAGVHAAANYLMFTYTPPGTVADPLTSYNATVSPVQYPAVNTSGHDVILSSSGVSANYPVGSVQSAFNTTGAGLGSFTAGNATVNYTASAKLIQVQQITPYLSSTAVTIPTWQITSDGTISGVRSATEEVTTTLEQQIVSMFGYAAFASSPGCSALTFGGGGITNSYDSTNALSGGVPVTSATSGNVGTNGNLSTNGNPTTINGNLSTPRTGTGTCSANNVTAWTSGSGHVTGSIIELPQAVAYPTPTVPAAGTLSITSNSGCPTVAQLATANANATCIATPSPGNGLTIGPINANGTVSLGDISLTGNKDLYLAPGTYNINTLKEAGQAELHINATTGSSVILNVTGSGGGTVVDLTGGSVTNTMGSFDPSTFQIIYAGTGSISLKGGSAAVGLMYAPNASYSFAGGGDWYGSVIGASMTDMGGAAIHYDRRLKDKYYMAGPYMLNSFTWNKY